jgi:hypothetical protein
VQAGNGAIAGCGSPREASFSGWGSPSEILYAAKYALPRSPGSAEHRIPADRCTHGVRGFASLTSGLFQAGTLRRAGSKRHIQTTNMTARILPIDRRIREGGGIRILARTLGEARQSAQKSRSACIAAGNQAKWGILQLPHSPSAAVFSRGTMAPLRLPESGMATPPPGALRIKGGTEGSDMGDSAGASLYAPAAFSKLCQRFPYDFRTKSVGQSREWPNLLFLLALPTGFEPVY